MTSEPSLAPPRVWTVALVVGLLLFLMVAGSGLVFGIWMGVELVLQGKDAAQPATAQALLGEIIRRPSAAIVGILLNVALMSAFALAAAGLSPVPWRERLRLDRPSHFPFTALVLAYVAALLLGHASTDVAQLGGWWREDGPLARFGELARASTPLQFGLMTLVGSLGAGVAEELFFRGYVQTRLVERWGRWPGIALTALAFGLVHMDWVHSSFAFLLGLLLGWVKERAGSIRPTVYVHVANNLLAFIWARWLPSSEGLGSRALVISLALSLPALALCVLGLHRGLRGNPVPTAEAVPAP